MSALEVGLAGEDIKRIFRLGRRNTSDTPVTSASSAARPMLVQFSSRWAKNALMENLFKLKSLDAKFKDTVVAHDMTKKERLECKALVEEAKTTRAQLLPRMADRTRAVKTILFTSALRRIFSNR